MNSVARIGSTYLKRQMRAGHGCYSDYDSGGSKWLSSDCDRAYGTLNSRKSRAYALDLAMRRLRLKVSLVYRRSRSERGAIDRTQGPIAPPFRPGGPLHVDVEVNGFSSTKRLN